MGQSSCNRDEILDPVTHFPGQQFMAFFSLLSTGHIEEDSEHHAINYALVAAVTTRRNPTHVISDQNAEVDFEGTGDQPGRCESSPHSV